MVGEKNRIMVNDPAEGRDYTPPAVRAAMKRKAKQKTASRAKSTPEERARKARDDRLKAAERARLKAACDDAVRKDREAYRRAYTKCLEQATREQRGGHSGPDGTWVENWRPSDEDLLRNGYPPKS